MSNRQGFIFAFSALLALGAGSVAQAQDDRYRKTDTYRGDDRYRYEDDRMYKDGIYADDDFWYGNQARVTNSRFRGMDRNRNGVIERTEWRGNNRSFTNQDWNNDGVLSGREVRASAMRVRNRNTRADAIDLNRDGFITMSEARLRYR